MTNSAATNAVVAYDVFLSSSSHDKPVTDAVCATLEARGIRCWVAPRDITPGMDWGEAIISGIEASRIMVLVFSHNANQSPQIRREIERALAKGLVLVPFRIENVAPSKALEYFLSIPHWLDAYTPPLEQHLTYLADTVAAILASGTVRAPSLELKKPGPRSDTRPPIADHAVLVAPRDPSKIDALVALAELLARTEPPHELILSRLIGAWSPEDREAVPEATADLNRRRSELIAKGVPCRAVAFTSSDAIVDIARLSERYPVDLILLDVTASDLESPDRSATLIGVMHAAQSDIALFVSGRAAGVERDSGRPVVTPFGGAEHDWGALQVAAWLASVLGAPLKLIGISAAPGSADRDASRLLADASLLVQQTTGIPTEPALVSPGSGVVDAVRTAGLIVMGLSTHSREEDLGEVRTAILREGEAPSLLLHRGPRSKIPAFAGDLTRYTWSRVPER